MSGDAKTTFEIQVLADKNWVIAELATDEGRAKAFADNLLQTGNHSAVRVVRDYRRADGLHTETVIQEKKAPERGGTDLSLAPIAEAPLCRELADFYGPEARLTMGRLLRKYLDEVVVTPSELLYDHKEMKRFGDKDRLLFSAIDRVALLQSVASNEDFKSRRDFLNASWDQMVIRAREAAARKLAAGKTLAEMLAAADGDAYLLRVLMAQKLLEARSWFGKLDLLLGWAGEEVAKAHMEAMDGVVADIVVSAQFIQDLLGFQPNLGSALCSLADLAEGKAQPAKFSPPCFAPLNALFASGRLPQARQVLLARVARELGGTNPLSRTEPKLEFEMFHRVAHRLISHAGVLGGTASAEALLQRSARVHSAPSANVAQNFLLSALNDTCLRVQFLVALARSPIAASMGSAVTDELIQRVRKCADIDGWLPRSVAPRDRMAALTRANEALMAATDMDMDEEVRLDLAARIDEVLAKYLVDEGVIEKIDKPDDPLAMRAIRMVKFCGSGVLIKGKSLNLAKQRVIDHLRQPQFEEKFLASVPDPGQGEKHLREFHKLLVESGFR